MNILVFLARAHIGIAIGNGSEIAAESAGVVLVNDKLTDVVVALILSRHILRRIRLNFGWALSKLNRFLEYGC